MARKIVLFVCLGNACRSPFAEELFNKLAEEKGLEWRALSAGIEPGIDTPLEARKAAREFGVTFAEHTPRIVTRKLLEASDLVLTMEGWQKEELIRTCPHCWDKIYTLTEYVGETGEIPDPYLSPATYTQVYRQIDKLLHKLVEKLSK